MTETKAQAKTVHRVYKMVSGRSLEEATRNGWFLVKEDVIATYLNQWGPMPICEFLVYMDETPEETGAVLKLRNMRDTVKKQLAEARREINDVNFVTLASPHGKLPSPTSTKKTWITDAKRRMECARVADEQNVARKAKISASLTKLTKLMTSLSESDELVDE